MNDNGLPSEPAVGAEPSDGTQGGKVPDKPSTPAPVLEEDLPHVEVDSTAETDQSAPAPELPAPAPAPHDAPPHLDVEAQAETDQSARPPEESPSTPATQYSPPNLTQESHVGTVQSATAVTTRRQWLKQHRMHVLLGVLLIVMFLVYAFTTHLIPSESMLPTLKPGDHILTMRSWLAYPRGSMPKRGDIIVFTLPRKPGQQESGGDESSGRQQIGIFRTKGEILIKRVAGLPGESVQVYLNDLKINGKKIDLPGEREPLAPDLDEIGSYGTREPLKLGPDELFLLGDNRNVSEDSRSWGPLKRNQVLGKCMGVLFHTKPPEKPVNNPAGSGGM